MKETTKKIAATLGAAGATMAGAAGAYYLYGSEDAAKNRRKVGAWMRRAEREIVHEAKRLKGTAFTQENANRIIAAVARRYKMARGLDPQDVQRFVAAVQKSWHDAGKTVKERAKEARQTSPARARKAKKSAASSRSKSKR